MKKKIKDLTLAEFHLFVIREMEKIKPYCFGKEPIEMLSTKTISEYLKEYGKNEVETDE